MDIVQNAMQAQRVAKCKLCMPHILYVCTHYVHSLTKHTHGGNENESEIENSNGLTSVCHVCMFIVCVCLPRTRASECIVCGNVVSLFVMHFDLTVGLKLLAEKETLVHLFGMEPKKDLIQKNQCHQTKSFQK